MNASLILDHLLLSAEFDGVLSNVRNFLCLTFEGLQCDYCNRGHLGNEN